MTRFALFDLDNTLVDQTGALRAWARQFIADRGLDPAAIDWLDVKGSAAAGWRQYVAGFKEHFGLADDVEDLVEEVTGTYPGYFELDDAVAAGLRRLRADGWLLGIVTNGASRMQAAKIDRVGLGSLVDAVVISQAAGSRKPERVIFDKCAARLGVELGPHGWMVGDSLEADVAGGVAAGLRTVWIRGDRSLPEGGVRPDHVCATTAQAMSLIADSHG